jgi:hypothetical protein
MPDCLHLSILILNCAVYRRKKACLNKIEAIENLVLSTNYWIILLSHIPLINFFQMF